MNKKFVAGAGVTLFALALTAKDPVIMTVNGVDVPKSEFEYLYGKNSQQQLSQQPLDEYVEMFKLYKMKVEDAKAEGIDTTAAFRKEMEQYRHDLAAPYLADSVFLEKLLKETYDRATQEVEVSHIMLFKSQNPAENAAKRQRIDSVRNALLSGADFAELAAGISEDRGSNQRGGWMGYISAQQYPYSFEVAAYATPEGEISEIVESPVGYHVLKGGKRRPARGKIQAAHILKMAQGNDPATDAKARHEIDSIYNIVKANPSAFSELATRHSDDRGSARQGGMLPWFGSGEMVAEFDSVAFSMPDNSISEPFRTAFGWHIINRIASRPIPSMEQMKPEFLARVTNPQDERYALVRDNQTARLAAKHKGKVNDKVVESIERYISTNALDSAFYSTYGNAANGSMTLVTIDGKKIPVSALVSEMKNMRQDNPEAALKIFDNSLASFYNSSLVEAEIDRLEREEPDYRNLLHEYIDGSLLYEVSVKKIWDKAAKDTEGLKQYFESHRENYKWSVPHAKGYLVQALNDSIADEVRKMAAVTGRDSIVNTIRKSFNGKVSIEKVLVEKGVNAMVDNLVFDGAPAKPVKKNFESFFMIDPRVLTEPEEYTDVRGLVTNDYQNEFQSQWEDELRKKYPVKVNQKVLKSVKK
ncbi:MAG: peptidylprolyl isomerase [Muribaculaceae bacterium]|nr:peptidylprolyl isomerase [Muribaculaceae bacterium]